MFSTLNRSCRPATSTQKLMLLFVRGRILAQARSKGRTPDAGDVYRAVMEGAVERVRPKMMTVTAIMAGLLPILWSHGAGFEVMSRIAAPMVGGMISSTVLTLLVIPAIYTWVKTRQMDKGV